MSETEKATILKQFQALATIAGLAEHHVDEMMRDAIRSIAQDGLAASPELLERYRMLCETKTSAQAFDMLAGGVGP